MGSYEKLFIRGVGGGAGRLIPVRNSSKSKYCSLFSKYSVGKADAFPVGGREATTGNASAVCRIWHGRPQTYICEC